MTAPIFGQERGRFGDELEKGPEREAGAGIESFGDSTKPKKRRPGTVDGRSRPDGLTREERLELEDREINEREARDQGEAEDRAKIAAKPREPADATRVAPRKFKSQAEWQDHMMEQSSGGPDKTWRHWKSRNWIAD